MRYYILLFGFIFGIIGFNSSQIAIQNNVLSTSGDTFITPTYVVDFTFGEVFTAILSDGNGTIYTQGFQQPAGKKVAIIDPINVSVNEYLQEGFSVYPNPFRDEVTIEFPNNLPVSIQIFDNAGRLIYKDDLSEIVNTIDFSYLSVGNYQLVLYSKESVFGRIPLIKSH